MTRNLVALISLSLLGAACSATPKTATAPHTAAAAKAKHEKAAKPATASDDGAAVVAVKDGPKVGDYVVQRITGSFSKKPLMLTQKIIARGDDHITVDYTLLEGRTQTRLRVERIESTGHVVRVSKMDGDKATSGDVNDFDAMMQKTAFAADDNEGIVGSEKQTCLVGGKEIDCEKTSYKVKIGGQDATMSVAHSDALPGQDVSGEIRTDDGDVVYHAQVIEVGNDAPTSSVASAE